MSSLPTIEEIVNLYLYGKNTVPSDLLAEAVAERPDGFVYTYAVDTSAYMAGPGRFASAADFELIRRFFDKPADPSIGYVFNFAPGCYTETTLRNLLGTSEALVSFNQSFFDDGKDNYIERSFIWGSTAFEIHDNATFVVNDDGSRYISEFAIVPYSSSDDPENFDFSSESIPSWATNLYTEPNIDPSRIGRKIEFNFVGNVQFGVLDYAGYRQAVGSNLHHDYGLVWSAPEKLKMMVNGLFQSGSTRFLDGHSRPILYGTSGSDEMFGTISRAGFDISGRFAFSEPHVLSDFVRNGLVYIAGDGEDRITGTDEGDIVYGNEGIDTLSGERGDDYLEGGIEIDFYNWSRGDGLSAHTQIA